MLADPWFIAVLLHDDCTRDVAVFVPRLEPGPPSEFEVLVEYGGAAALDVYECADAGSWPDLVVLRHRETVPCTVMQLEQATLRYRAQHEGPSLRSRSGH
ncbi:hypothetical protein ACRAWC_15815 [Leifsonia sp. L25]|uniref:hypothetical protein n=1 Tax=Actinomycetes TaxID=1760 RepID=UPI003D68CAC1